MLFKIFLYSFYCLLNKNTVGFGVFHLVSNSLAELAYSNNFSVDSFGFPTSTVILFISNNSFTCSFIVLCLLFIFFTLARTSSTVSRGSGNRDHSWHFPISKGKLSTFTTKYDVCSRTFVDGL